MPAPNDPNSSELQRDQPAIEPGPTPVEESAAFSMEEVISEIIPNPETVSAIIEFLNQEQLEPEDVEVTAGMWGWDESADINHQARRKGVFRRPRLGDMQEHGTGTGQE